MVMKKRVKVIINLILIFLLICSFSPKAFAETIQEGGGGAVKGGTTGAGTVEDVVSNANDFIDKGKKEESPIIGDELKKGSSLIYNVLFMIGIGVTLIWGTVLGIKFVTGTVEEKADIKGALIPYIVGCVIIFGAFGIWKLVLNLLSSLS